MSITIKWAPEAVFSTQYKRVTRLKTRKKNMRCFPQCSEEGHKPGTFCGRSVAVDIAYDLDAAKNLDIITYAEFRPHQLQRQVQTGSLAFLGCTRTYEQIQKSRYRVPPMGVHAAE